MTERTPRAPSSLVLPMRTVLRGSALFTVIAIPLGAAIGYAVDGWAGVAGAVLGIVVPLVFFTLTVAVALGTARMHPNQLGVAVLATWLGKLVGLVAVLAVLRGMDFFNRPMFFACVLIGTVVYLVMEALIVARTKVLYVEPELAGPQR